MMKMQMIMFSVMASLSLVADTHVWTGGGTDADWTDALNFDIGKPDSGDVVVIPSGQTVKIGDATSLALVKDLAELKVDGVLFTSFIRRRVFLILMAAHTADWSGLDRFLSAGMA